MTPREKVLRRLPTAYAERGTGFYAGMWSIKERAIPTNSWSNHFHTPAAAWAEAAKNLPRTRSPR